MLTCNELPFAEKAIAKADDVEHSLFDDHFTYFMSNLSQWNETGVWKLSHTYSSTSEWRTCKSGTLRIVVCGVARTDDVYRVAYIGVRKAKKYMMLMQNIVMLRKDDKTKESVQVEASREQELTGHAFIS